MQPITVLSEPALQRSVTPPGSDVVSNTWSFYQQQKPDLGPAIQMENLILNQMLNFSFADPERGSVVNSETMLIGPI